MCQSAQRLAHRLTLALVGCQPRVILVRNPDRFHYAYVSNIQVDERYALTESLGANARRLEIAEETVAAERAFDFHR